MENESKRFFTFLEDNELYAMFISEKLKENFNCHITINKTLDDFVSDTAMDSKTDIFILDYNLPKGNAMEAIRTLKKKKVDAEIILLSSQTNIQNAVDSLKAGAFDYIIKNEEAVERLIRSIQRASAISDLKKENFTLKIQINKYKIFGGLILVLLLVWICILLFFK